MSSFSVVIPSNHSSDELLNLVQYIVNQSLQPNQIIIVDSNVSQCPLPFSISNLCHDSSIELVYVHENGAFPGRARNVGSQFVTSEYICFLDVKTLPSKDWLKNAFKQISDNDIDGVWGNTFFDANCYFSSCLRDGIYGRKARQTLPGSVLTVSSFRRVGQFVPWARAGEDTDWISRSKLLSLRVSNSNFVSTTYIGLLNKSYLFMIRKWLKYNIDGGLLPHLLFQRVLIFFLIYTLIIYIGYNWNNLYASWDPSAVFYIPNITKALLFLPVLFYFLLRSIFLPVIRGVPLQMILNLRFISIFFIVLPLDLLKMAGFLSALKSYLLKK